MSRGDDLSHLIDESQEFTNRDYITRVAKRFQDSCLPIASIADRIQSLCLYHNPSQFGDGNLGMAVLGKEGDEFLLSIQQAPTSRESIYPKVADRVFDERQYQILCDCFSVTPGFVVGDSIFASPEFLRRPGEYAHRWPRMGGPSIAQLANNGSLIWPLDSFAFELLIKFRPGANDRVVVISSNGELYATGLNNSSSLYNLRLSLQELVNSVFCYPEHQLWELIDDSIDFENVRVEKARLSDDTIRKYEALADRAKIAVNITTISRFLRQYEPSEFREELLINLDKLREDLRRRLPVRTDVKDFIAKTDRSRLKSISEGLNKDLWLLFREVQYLEEAISEDESLVGWPGIPYCDEDISEPLFKIAEKEISRVMDFLDCSGELTDASRAEYLERHS